jgi:hypothetical protein
MNQASNGRRWPRLGEVVDTYEAALAVDGQAAISDFVPSADHPERLSILCELIRVDSRTLSYSMPWPMRNFA